MYDAVDVFYLVSVIFVVATGLVIYKLLRDVEDLQEDVNNLQDSAEAMTNALMGMHMLINLNKKDIEELKNKNKDDEENENE